MANDGVFESVPYGVIYLYVVAIGVKTLCLSFFRILSLSENRSW